MAAGVGERLGCRTARTARRHWSAMLLVRPVLEYLKAHPQWASVLVEPQQAPPPAGEKPCQCAVTPQRRSPYGRGARTGPPHDQVDGAHLG